MDSTFTVIGKPQIRKDARAKVCGLERYTADVPADDVVCGVVVRSPHHHARIRALDSAAARACPGIIAVVTAADVPGQKTFGLVPDQPPLAEGEVCHLGQPVAVVLARDLEIAQAAAEKLRIDYEVLPAVFDPQAALLPEAPLVHPGGNLLSHYEVDSGDLAAGFASAAEVIADTFTVQRQAPAYLEPETSLAVWDPATGSIKVWVSSQEPFVDRANIAAVLGLPLEKVQVLSTAVGGAFGGKEDSSMAVLTALTAYCGQCAVRLVNQRSASFLAHPKRHPARIQLRLGAQRDGTLTALEAQVWLNTGAFASYGPAVGSLLTEMLTGPYHISNVHLDTKVIYTHSPYAGAMRGFGSPQAHFAIESLMDMLADRLHLDPAELRRRNLLTRGDLLPTRVVLNETALGLKPIHERAVAARERLRSIPAKPGKVSGVGLALAMQSMGLGAKIIDRSDHRLEWQPDGHVLIYLGAPELGQGLKTVAEQITAETLGLPFEQVSASTFDTHIVPDGGVTCASRMTYLVGNAMLTGARALQQQLLVCAADLLHLPQEQLNYAHGRILLPDGSSLPAAEITSRIAEKGTPLQVETSALFPYPPETTPQHLPIGMPHVKYVFAAQIVRVEVDPELGSVEVTDVVAIHDLGRIINRLGAEGQIEGGVVMGLGYALLEDMAQKPNGQWVDSFSEYLLPTSLDVPPHLEVEMLEYPEYDGPYGAKGLAEICLVPTGPAVANAVFDAVHVRVKDLPITPEKVCHGEK
ncbi:MAG: xanthine dehydrogenase family protein molybdopterin-binding subunit [Anaerolineaceae bacterium]|nr:xanthine dehydrogenase family protein molybdopterin-binding subunit [Anaerolineaceae bacterium]